MITTFFDFHGKMQYILVFGYSKAQMQKHNSIFIFVGRFFVFSWGVNFHFREWTCTLLVTMKMEMYIFAGRTLFTQQSQEKSFSHALSEFAIQLNSPKSHC